MGAIEKQILEIEKQMVDAFNKGNIEDILKHFDEDVIGFSSTRHERLMGLDDMRETFLFYLKEADSLEFSITSPLIKVYSDSVAVMTYYWTVVMISGLKRREIHGRGTHVYAVKNGIWKVVHEQFSRVYQG